MLVKANVRLAHNVLPGAVIDMDEGPKLDRFLEIGWVTDVSTVDARLAADGHKPKRKKKTTIEVPKGARLVDMDPGDAP
jgi:hypothetical protein